MQLELECPVCQAKPSERCITISRKSMSHPHSKRLIAAMEQEHLRSQSTDTKAPADTNG